MFGLSFFEILVIALIALLLLGPEKLPEAAQNFGKLSAKFRKFSDQFRKDFYNSVFPPAEDLRKDLADIKKNLRGVQSSFKEEVKTITKIDDKAE